MYDLSFTYRQICYRVYLMIITVYAPKEGEEHESKLFYQKLQEVVNSKYKLYNYTGRRF